MLSTTGKEKEKRERKKSSTHASRACWPKGKKKKRKISLGESESRWKPPLTPSSPRSFCANQRAIRIKQDSISISVAVWGQSRRWNGELAGRLPLTSFSAMMRPPLRRIITFFFFSISLSLSLSLSSLLSPNQLLTRRSAHSAGQSRHHGDKEEGSRHL
jgi:hypothetical protein